MQTMTTLRKHWPEYVMEAAGLALFMIPPGLFRALLGDPESAVHQAVASPLLRRALMGLVMGLTAVGIHLLAVGQTVRGAPEPGHDLDVPPAGQDRPPGRLRVR